MLAFTIQSIIISITFIFLLDYLINFFKTTLTVPKLKDFVNSPNKTYHDIYSIINKPDYPVINMPEQNTIYNESSSDINSLPTSKNINMKEELKSFLKKQLVS
uniref:Uncharacterized protein n=1 Tax=viral metagenome TaxID=1070528 RepID=A0A6C0LKV9_9ZZZZ